MIFKFQRTQCISEQDAVDSGWIPVQIEKALERFTKVSAQRVGAAKEKIVPD